MLNVPGPVLAVVASIVLPYLLESFAPAPLVDGFGLSPVDVAQGRLWPLFTVMLVHASWAHAGLNALGVLAFGPPVARWFGAGRWTRFLIFYVVCGLLSSLAYVAIHWGRAVLLVGASGAISGLMGASSRLLDQRGRLAPFRSRTVISMAGAWLVINLLLALRLIDVGAGGEPVAWEAHLAGYAAGLLLISPISRLFIADLRS